MCQCGELKSMGELLFHGQFKIVSLDPVLWEEEQGIDICKDLNIEKPYFEAKSKKKLF